MLVGKQIAIPDKIWFKKNANPYFTTNFLIKSQPQIDADG